MDRVQPYLLPPSVQDFVPEDDLAWFLVDAVALMDTAVFHRRARLGGAGRAGYDPDMLLTLLCYAYCLGHRSSRKIEQLCVRDLGFKLVTGNLVVDHTTIAEFRRVHQDAVGHLFTEVLLLCARAGLRQVGVVAVDGTKMAASAGLGTTRERQALAAEQERLAAQVAAMLAEHAATDAHQDTLFGPDQRGDELPAELRRRAGRLARLNQTLRQIEQARAAHDEQEHGPTPTGRPRRADKVAAAQHVLDQLVNRRDERLAKEAAAGRRLPGSRPDFDALIAQAETDLAAAREATTPTGTGPNAEHTTPPETTPGTDLALRPSGDVEHPPTPGTDPSPPTSPAGPGTDLALRPGCSLEHLPSAARRGNPTDPDSRVLKTHHGWLQAYNCQAAVVRVQHGRRLVLAAQATQDANDTHQAIPMTHTAVTNTAHAGLGTIDLIVFDAGYWSEDNLTAPGPDRLIAPGKNRTLLTELRTNGYTTGNPPPDASPANQMRHRLHTQTGAETYAQRAPTVEPLFGDIKHNRGITHFQRRGTPAADSEWKLINATNNLATLHRHSRSLNHPTLHTTITQHSTTNTN